MFTDLFRLHVYAPHVKILGGPRVRTYAAQVRRKYKTSRAAFDALFRLLSAEVLFPNICQVYVVQLDIPYLSMLLGPYVESLSLGVERNQLIEDPRTLQVLRSIPHRCPRLRRLYVGGSSTATEFLDTIIELVPALENITDLTMPFTSIPQTALEALAFSPDLKRLHIVLPELDDGFAHTLAINPKGRLPFNELVSLTLEAAFPEHTLRFLGLVSSRHLLMLMIHYATVPDAQQLKALFTVLASHPCRRKLRGLSLEAPCEAPARRLTNSTFTPLLKLRSLRLLTLRFFLVDVDDTGLLVMARAWPDLTKLSLGVQRWGDDHQPHATIFGLIPLIEACPRLYHIGYRMRTDLLRLYDPLKLHGRPGNGIESERDIELEVGDSRIHDPVEVASFLSDICPKLWFIGSLWRTVEDLDDEEYEEIDIDDEEDMSEKWNKVVEYLPHFALVRRQERNSRR